MMKNLFIILISSFILTSCGGEENSVETVIKSGDLSKIREMKSQLNQEQKEINEKIALLNAEIEKLDKNENRTLVTVMKVEDTLFDHYIEVQGSVGTDENIVVYPEYSGILEEIYVEEGEKVSTGEILAKIDDGGLSSQLAQLKTKAALAKTTFERQKRLWDQNIGSEIQFLEAKSNYQAMQSAVEQLESQLGKTIVRAPFSGVIDQVLTDPGQVVNPGQNPLFRLMNLNNMYVTADVPENYLGSIAEGTKAIVEIEAIGEKFIGEIKEISGFINPNNRSFEIKISLPNRENLIRPNLIATVRLNDYSAEDALIIPTSAVRENALGEQITYIVEIENDSAGTAREIKVETGKSYEGMVEVKEGLDPGQLVILKGSRTIRNGEKVIVKNEVKSTSNE